ncbi:hypothetical protein SAMN05428642_104164 [Flaviramulus basaltis]|uniref:Uncharacterized protein n=1 Tax=Flaviramulus basaltis TaxID=369401 RepID=A0A1K2IQD0_9FLAO|nr:hypothetical protein SAMN05428642_104164 [Flaviramulus basaltis]
MKDLFYQLYTPVVYFLEAFAALTGILTYKKYKNTVVKYFVYFLIYTFIQDSISQIYTRIYLNYYVKGMGMTWLGSNYWWYTLFWNIGSSLFYLYYFSLILKIKSHKNILKITAILLIIYAFTIIVFNFKYFIWHSFVSIDILNMLIIFLCVSFYFVKVLSSNKILEFYKSFNFYISTVILMWWLVTTPLIFYNHFYYYGIDENFKLIQYTVLFVANVFMYLSFILLLILYKSNKKLVINDINL